MKRYIFETMGHEVVFEATSLHTALYRLGLWLEERAKGKWGVGCVHNYHLCTLKRIENKPKAAKVAPVAVPTRQYRVVPCSKCGTQIQVSQNSGYPYICSECERARK
jgi:hypothetical protein